MVGTSKSDRLQVIPRRLSDGTFSHEANMCDPDGYVYQTEDSDLCGFYKFVPHRRGRLHLGGRLYMLRVRNEPNADLGVTYPVATSWEGRLGANRRSAGTDDVLLRARCGEGRATFRRLEGAWWGDRTGYFLSTNGGAPVVNGRRRD